MALLLKVKTVFINRGETKIDAAEYLKDRIVALYFAAQWCQPCCVFSPLLKEFYEQLDGKPFEIVVICTDLKKPDFKDCIEDTHPQWVTLAFGDPLINELKRKYDVTTVPVLTIIKPNGEVICKSARSDIQGTDKKPIDMFNAWQKAASM